jgi:hypothetical protein
MEIILGIWVGVIVGTTVITASVGVTATTGEKLFVLNKYALAKPSRIGKRKINILRPENIFILPYFL